MLPSIASMDVHLIPFLVFIFGMMSFLLSQSVISTFLQFNGHYTYAARANYLSNKGDYLISN